MKKIPLTIVLVLSVLLSLPSTALAAPFDLTHTTDSTKNYTFFSFIDQPSIFDYVRTNLTNYQIEAENGIKYNTIDVNQKTMTGMTFTQAIDILQATAEVVIAENSKLQADVDNAQVLVTALPASTDKTSLQARLDAVVASIPVTPTAPLVTSDDALNTVAGMEAGMEYNLDGAGYVAYIQATFNAINFAGNHTLLVRVSAAGINPPSADTTLTFTMSVTEDAEIAVDLYEASPITNITEVTIAEGLKAPADVAVAAVTDPTLKAAFELRISTRAAVIASAKASMLGTDITAQAAAETAVTAFEGATLANIAQINTATGLKTTAEAKVAAIQDPTAKAGFTSRINIKMTAMAIAHINLETYFGSMGTALINYSPILGIDLTDYNTLANKEPVQTALIAPTFTTTAEIKATFDSAVAAQKAAEGGVVEAFNSATVATQIETAISTYATQLQLGLTEYNALTATDKTNVQIDLLSNKPYASGEDIKLAFVIAVINKTTTAGVGTLLYNNAGLLGLGQNEYATLSTKSYIEAAVLAARPITDKTKILVLAYDSTVLRGYIGQMLPINGAFLGLDLTDYNGLTHTNKLSVQDALLVATITNQADLKLAFDSAVTTQKSSEVGNVAAFNNAPDEAAMATVITTYITGTSLSNYNGLAYKVPVQTALLTPTYYTFVEVVAAFDGAVAAQKTVESAAITAINNATTTADMATAINAHALTLGLNLADYNAFPIADQSAVQTTMIEAYTFYSVSALKTAFDGAVTTQKSVIAVNTASAGTMGNVITTNATVLGLNLSDYNLLTAPSKDIVDNSLVGKAFPDKVTIKAAFELSVSVPIINEITIVSAMGTAIGRYATQLGLSLTDYNLLSFANKGTVQTALIGKAFADKDAVKGSFDLAVSLAKDTQAVAAINGALTATAMNTAITTNATVLGLSLTDYNSLTNKVPVQTALMGQAFPDNAAVKVAFDAAVADRKAIETPQSGTTGVTLNKTASYMLLGGTETLIATVLPADSTNKAVIWTSSNPARIAVDSNGVMTGVAVGGPNTITVTTVDGYFTATCTVIAVTEQAAIYQVTQLSIDYTAQHIPLYSSALGLDLTAYNLLDDQYSVQAALFRGTFNTATDLRAAFNAAVLAATPVPVAPDAPTWVINDDAANTVDGMDIYLEYALDGAAYVTYDIDTFSAIDFSGVHTLLVRVASDGFNPAGADLTLVFTTNPAVAVNGVTLDQQTLTLTAQGADGILIATVDPANAANQLVTWSSSDITVATVLDGVVTPLAAGTTIITVTTADGDFTATCTVTVN